jgi:hypothetical protein
VPSVARDILTGFLITADCADTRHWSAAIPPALLAGALAPAHSG